MMESIILFILLIFLVGLNNCCIRIIRKNPNLISGFKMSADRKQRVYDIIFIDSLVKYFRIANIVTLCGGIAGILCDSNILYYLSLILPIFIASFFAYSRRKGNYKINTILFTLFFMFSIVFFPIIYLCYTDLEINIDNDKISVGGIYGQNIPLSDIKSVNLCMSLPEIDIRTNGFSLFETHLGHFRTKDNKNIMLFAHSKECFICINQMDGMTYYISYKNSNSTECLFFKMRDRIKKRNKIIRQ